MSGSGARIGRKEKIILATRPKVLGVWSVQGLVVFVQIAEKTAEDEEHSLIALTSFTIHVFVNCSIRKHHFPGRREKRHE